MIKTYTKSSLALEYFPEYVHRPRTAVQHLMRWINMNPELCTRLYATDRAFVAGAHSPSGRCFSSKNTWESRKASEVFKGTQRPCGMWYVCNVNDKGAGTLLTSGLTRY